MKIKQVVFSAVGLWLAVTAGAVAGEKKLQVLASFLPMYAHTKSIVGDLADVQMFIDRDAEPHDYQPKPSDMKKLAAADLFVINGAGVEEWLGALLKNAGKRKPTVVDASAGIGLLDNSAVFFTGSEDEEHEHGEKNPHVWLDPVLAQKQVKNILAALVAADAKNADAYRKNADAYLAQLRKLDEDYREATGKLKNKNLVTFHNAFPYLAKRYGFNYLGCISQFPEQDPKPAELKALVQSIKKNNVKVIFAEQDYEPKLLREIARQTGATVSVLDTLEIGKPTADAYLVGMHNNLKTLTEAWSKP